MDIYANIIKLAKSVHAQNLFLASKEIASIKLFKNSFELSHLQEFYLSYLYTFENLNKDIITEHISSHVLDEEVFWESYLLWKKSDKRKQTEKKSKQDKKTKNADSQYSMHLVVGNTIKFPVKEK